MPRHFGCQLVYRIYVSGLRDLYRMRKTSRQFRPVPQCFRSFLSKFFAVNGLPVRRSRSYGRSTSPSKSASRASLAKIPPKEANVCKDEGEVSSGAVPFQQLPSAPCRHLPVYLRSSNLKLMVPECTSLSSACGPASHKVSRRPVEDKLGRAEPRAIEKTHSTVFADPSTA